MTGRTAIYGALDLGGTKVRALVADLEGNVYGEDIRPSRAAEGGGQAAGRPSGRRNSLAGGGGRQAGSRAGSAAAPRLARRAAGPGHERALGRARLAGERCLGGGAGGG